MTQNRGAVTAPVDRWVMILHNEDTMEWLIIGWIGTMLAFGLGGYEFAQTDKYSTARGITLFITGQIMLMVFIAGVVAVNQG